MATNSNRKGKRGERKACKLLEAFGWGARRSQQYSGVRDDATSADILTDLDDHIRFEVKYGADKTDIYNKRCKDWIEQVKAETPKDKQWAILRKKTRQKWTLIFEIDGVVCQSADIKEAINLLIQNND